MLNLGERQPHEALATLLETLGAERSVHDRHEMTLLCPVNFENAVRLDNCQRYGVNGRYNPYLSELAAREMPSLWVSKTELLASDVIKAPVPATTDSVGLDAGLGLVIGEQLSWVASDCCLVSEHHGQCVGAGS
jgi:hypothetical protein